MLIFEISYWDYPIIFIVLSLLFLYMGYQLIVNPKTILFLNKYYKADLKKWILVSICFLLSILLPLFGGIVSFYKIDRAISEQKYNKVEGTIKNFFAKKCNTKEYDSFTVNNMVFRYTNLSGLSPYYHQTACEGGLIKNNGQRVKIYYLTVGGQNKIIKMWLQ